MFYLYAKVKSANVVHTCLDYATNPGQHRVAVASIGHQGDQAGMHVFIIY